MASSVNLGPVLEAAVDGLVANGRYGSRSEVLREGVRLVQEREAAWARLEAEIMVGIDDVEAGRTHGIEETFDDVRRAIQSRADAKHAA